jgi:hypothetical protein
MSLQGSLDAFRANFEAGGPPYNAPEWMHESMHRDRRAHRLRRGRAID